MAEQQPAVPQQGPTRGYAHDILEPGVDETLPQPLQNLLAKDYPLSNIRSGDREYFRLLGENVALYVEEEFPPEESLVQGELGAALLEDPDYETHAQSPRQKTKYETILMDAFARSSRGVEGWQQDELSKSTNVRRIEDGREPQEETGIVGGLFKTQ
jgi:hypothetical protein